jgi:hypothetical protein
MVAKHEELHNNSPILNTELERFKLFHVIYLYLEDSNFSEDIGFKEIIKENFVLVDFMGSLETDIEAISASYDQEGNIHLYVREFSKNSEYLYFMKVDYEEE